MRRLFLLGFGSLLLSGCAFHEWSRPPFFSGPDPYAPTGNTENIRRALGQPAPVAPLSAAPGNVWPGPLPPTPTLEDLVKQERNGQLPPAQQLPGQPTPPGIPPQFRNAPVPEVPVIPPVPNAASPGAGPPSPPEAGNGTIITPEGPAATTGGTGAFKTVTLPNGQTGIVVPNGNGTSTLILNNGQVQTIPNTK